MVRGKTAVIPWPEIKIGTDIIESEERCSQSVIDAWGAARRAFLSSCIEDRKWMEVEEDIDTFYGEIQNSNWRIV